MRIKCEVQEIKKPGLTLCFATVGESVTTLTLIEVKSDANGWWALGPTTTLQKDYFFREANGRQVSSLGKFLVDIPTTVVESIVVDLTDDEKVIDVR